jgi:hypothetical protein
VMRKPRCSRRLGKRCPREAGAAFALWGGGVGGGGTFLGVPMSGGVFGVWLCVGGGMRLRSCAHLVIDSRRAKFLLILPARIVASSLMGDARV